MGKAVLRGILWSFLGVFPAVILIGILFRFPVPYRGYVQGWELFQEGLNATIELVWILLQATLYYTFWGGFLPLAVLGTVAGMLGWWLGRTDRVQSYTRNIALGLAFLAAGVLSVLDKVIGAW
jgi:hypothetical protein